MLTDREERILQNLIALEGRANQAKRYFLKKHDNDYEHSLSEIKKIYDLLWHLTYDAETETK